MNILHMDSAVHYLYGQCHTLFIWTVKCTLNSFASLVIFLLAQVLQPLCNFRDSLKGVMLS